VKGPAAVRELFDDVRNHVEGLNVPYAVMGGIAATAWGMPHFTHDVDLALGVGAADAGPLLRALDAAGYLVPDEFLRGWTDRLAGTRKVVVRKFIGEHVWDVDLFLQESEFLGSVIARRRIVDLDGRMTPLVSPEDLVLFKLVAGRPKDQGHLDDLLLVVGPLDDAYLVSWAEKLGVRDRLAAQWQRSGRTLP